MEYLDPGVIAVKLDSNNVYVGWHMMGTDPDNTAFNVCWNGIKINNEPFTNLTKFMDTNFDSNVPHTVCSIIDSNKRPPSKPVKIWNQNYIRISLQTPQGHTPDDGSVGDLITSCILWFLRLSLKTQCDEVLHLKWRETNELTNSKYKAKNKLSVIIHEFTMNNRLIML